MRSRSYTTARNPAKRVRSVKPVLADTPGLRARVYAYTDSANSYNSHDEYAFGRNESRITRHLYTRRGSGSGTWLHAQSSLRIAASFSALVYSYFSFFRAPYAFSFPSPHTTPRRRVYRPARRGGVRFRGAGGSAGRMQSRTGVVVGGRRAVQYGRGRGGETNYGRPPILPARSAVRVNTVPLTARTTRSPPLPGTKPPVPPSSWVARRGRGQPSDANVPEKMFSSSLDCSNKL